MKANIGLNEEHSQSTAYWLNTLLADEYVLYIKTKYYHWNVVSTDFHELHHFFGGQGEQMEDIIDALAQRIRSIGHFTLGTMKDFLALTRLKENHHDISSALSMTHNLLQDHETIIQQIRQEIDVIITTCKDVGTGDLLVALLEKHEKMAWMLRSHLP